MIFVSLFYLIHTLFNDDVWKFNTKTRFEAA
jgi:hypothetical protein